MTSLIPYNQFQGYYTYPELETEWPILYDAKSDDGQMLRRTISQATFEPYTFVEIRDLPADPSEIATGVVDFALFHFYIERPMIVNNFEGQYTWSLNSARDENGVAMDPAWEYNRFVGWQASGFEQLHKGRYHAREVMHLKFGLEMTSTSTKIKVKNTDRKTLLGNDDDDDDTSSSSSSSASGRSSGKKLNTSYSSATQTTYTFSGRVELDGTARSSRGSSYTVKLPANARAVQVVAKINGATASWGNGTPILGIANPIEVQDDTIVVTIPSTSIRSVTKTTPSKKNKKINGRNSTSISIGNSADIELNTSYIPGALPTKVDSDFYANGPYVEVLAYTEELFTTVGIDLLDVTEPFWVVHDSPDNVDVNDPLPPNTELPGDIRIEQLEI